MLFLPALAGVFPVSGGKLTIRAGAVHSLIVANEGLGLKILGYPLGDRVLAIVANADLDRTVGEWAAKPPPLVGNNEPYNLKLLQVHLNRLSHLGIFVLT